MLFDDYQTQAAATATYLSVDKYVYTALGLFNEAGEVAGKVKKWLRDDRRQTTPERAAAVHAEGGDLAWYCAALCTDFGLRLGDVARAATAADFAAAAARRWGALYGERPPDSLPLAFPERCGLRLGAAAGRLAGQVDDWLDQHLAHRPAYPPGLPGGVRRVLSELVFLLRWFDLRLDDALAANLVKLADRRRRGVIAGEGDTR